MLKIISLMKRDPSIPWEDFARWASTEHPEFGKALPGLRRYVMNVAVADVADAPYDVVSELWFDDEQAFTAAFATDEGKAAGADVAAHVSWRTRLQTTEHEII